MMMMLLFQLALAGDYADCMTEAGGRKAREACVEVEFARLQARIDALEQHMQAHNKPVPLAVPNPEAENAARALLVSCEDAIESGDIETARNLLEQLKATDGNAQIARVADRLEKELAVIGQPAGDLTVEKWYSNAQTTYDDSKVTLIVFWEIWCPHCAREVPKLQTLWEARGGDGLEVLGLTRLTRSATEEKVTSFIAENGLTYPMAKEDGSMAKRFDVSGIPAAAVVVDGVVAWRGHPARITDEMLDRWLQQVE